MNIRLGDGSVRLRLNGTEAETLLSVNQLTITISWVTGTDLRVSMILSADAARPRVRGEGLELLVVVPRSDFMELLEQYGRRDASISWKEFGADGRDVEWSIDIDAFRPRSKSERSQPRVDTMDML
ncbi:MAG TPA: hypothetical protein VE954_34265 [Oligoflexus sp.]|uniref:hypothetical protein n=1 Tax=Oligoflexus sp. TaxID=1971216 RepID=UPI002D30B159|nr:hypothetical protein [Oligoflexus sp.]HYX38194.1 hypothetical protein [Oligoflexus sp.]